MQLTPTFGIPVPDKTTKLPNLGDELLQAFTLLEQKLIAAGLPAATPSPVITAGSSAGRDAVLGVPGTAAAQRALQDRGVLVVRTDLGTLERYYALFDAATNPGGTTVAGWYGAPARPGGTVSRTTDTGAGGTNTTDTLVAFTSSSSLRGFSYSSAQPTRLTCQARGRYMLSALALIGSTTTASAYMRLNGGRRLGPRATEAQAGGLATVECNVVVDLVPGDYLELLTVSNGAFNLYASTRLSADLLNIL